MQKETICIKNKENQMKSINKGTPRKIANENRTETQE